MASRVVLPQAAFSQGLLEAARDSSVGLAKSTRSHRSPGHCALVVRCSLCNDIKTQILSHVAGKKTARKENCFSPGVCYIERALGSKREVALALSLDVAPPPIDEDLLELMMDEGAEISEDGVPLTFGNDAEAVQAALGGGVAVVDLSHHGRVLVRGEDRVRFLHNQTTADVAKLREGEGCEAAMVDPQARVKDLVSVWAMRSALMLVVSPELRREIVPALDRFLFMADKITLEDITDKTHFLTLVGSASGELLAQIGASEIVGKPHGTHNHFSFQGNPVTVAVGSGVALDGFQLLLSTEAAAVVWRALVEGGAIPMGTKAWEHVRITQGRPAVGRELTPDFNAFEAGLWHTVSLSKGCYLGQETLARIVTYGNVKQQLWGLRLDGPVEPGTAVTANGEKVGMVTSYTSGFGSDSPFALAYIRGKSGSEGLEVEVGNVKGVVTDIPYATRTMEADTKGG